MLRNPKRKNHIDAHFVAWQSIKELQNLAIHSIPASKKIYTKMKRADTFQKRQ